MSNENPIWFGSERGPRKIERIYDSHAIGDRCPATVLDGVSTNTSDLFHSLRFLYQFRARLQALGEFKRKLNTTTESLADFHEGMVFDPNDYPRGTILRLEAALDWFQTAFPPQLLNQAMAAALRPGLPTEEEYTDKQGRLNVFGIIATAPSTGRHSVIQLPEKQNVLQLNEYEHGSKLLEPPYKLGDWLHQVWLSGRMSRHYDGREPGHLHATHFVLRRIQDDIFYRVTRVEILQIGAGDRPKERTIFQSFPLILRRQEKTV